MSQILATLSVTSEESKLGLSEQEKPENLQSQNFFLAEKCVQYFVLLFAAHKERAFVDQDKNTFGRQLVCYFPSRVPNPVALPENKKANC